MTAAMEQPGMDQGSCAPSEVPAGTFLAERQRYVDAGPLMLGYWTAPLARTIHPHHHSDAHFLLVTSGAYATRAGRNGSPDDALLIFNPAGTEHEDHLETGGAFFTLTIRRASYLEQICSLPDAPMALASSAAHARARLLLRELSSWQPDSGIAAQSLAAELLIAMVAAPARKDPPKWLSDARDLMEECYREALDVQGIAVALGVHPFHLIRCFRAHFGTTPGEYLRARRVRAAAALLTHTSTPLAEVALEAGFADQAHLTHRFSDAYGMPPGIYRRRTQL